MQKSNIKTDFIPAPDSLPAFEADLTANHADTVRTISGMAIEPSLDTLELPSEPWPGSPRWKQKEPFKFVEAKSAELALGELRVLSFPMARDVGGRMIFEETDLNRLRLAEANIWWVDIPDNKKFLAAERGRTMPMYAIGERMHSPSEGYADAKTDMLLISAYSVSGYGRHANFYTATVSSVAKDRIDELSQQKLIVPPSSQEVAGQYTPRHKPVTPKGSLPFERSVDATVYRFAQNKLRTISDPALRGIKLQRVPNDDDERARFYERFDASLQEKGLRADKLTQLTRSKEPFKSGYVDIESMIEPYGIYQHTLRLASVFDEQVKHAEAFYSIEEWAGYLARTAAGHQS